MFYMLQEQLARFVISARYFILSSNTSNLNVFHLQDAECTLTLSSRTFLSTEDASAVMMRKYQRHYSPRKEAPDRILKELEELHAILLKFNTKQLISPQQINLSDATRRWFSILSKSGSTASAFPFYDKEKHYYLFARICLFAVFWRIISYIIDLQLRNRIIVE